MAPQLNYSIDQSGAAIGTVADMGLDNIRASAAAAGPVHVGALVILTNSGTQPCPSPGMVSDIADNASSFPDFGIALRDDTRMPYTDDGTGNAVYVAGDMVSVLIHGRGNIYCETACTDGDPVYARVLAAGANNKGRFRNSTATNFILVPNAKFKSTLAAAGIAKVELA